MRALQFTEYGGPEVLEWAEAPDPHAGPGQCASTDRLRWVASGAARRPGDSAAVVTAHS